MQITYIFIESFRIALHSLRTSKMRSFLSLLGISLGIFSIIAVKSAVDSFHDTIASGFSEFGSDILYVDQRPWIIKSRKEWMSYNKRPTVDYEYYEHLRDNLESAKYITFSSFTGGKTIKYNSNSVSNAFIIGSTLDYLRINDLEFEEGRFLNSFEYENATNKVILGATVASSLFEGLDPIGKKVKLLGQHYYVIGILKKEGESMFNFMNFDEAIWIGYKNMKKYINVKDINSIGNSLAIKANPGVDLDDIKDEIIGFMRPKRHLKPRENNDFSINEIGMLNEMLDEIFTVINLAGFVIGLFALIIGMFSVANIMFVSVKERTSIIGIKKALGAHNNVILAEFLIEAVILCIIGGLIGVGMVYFTLLLVSNITPITMYISPSNVFTGLVVSIIVGIISGIAPAYLASRMNPVEAIRK